MLWLPEELETDPPRGRAAIVVDVIRATTSIATAFAAGAERVIPVRSVEGAREEAGRDGEALLCGERRGLPPRGFDLGNAPGEFGRGSVAGRALVFTTTNGTAAIEAARAAGVGSLRLGCFRNAGAVARRVAADANAAERGVAIVCAGRRGRVSMDDAWCAGHLVERLVQTVAEAELTDGARAAQALSARLDRRRRPVSPVPRRAGRCTRSAEARIWRSARGWMISRSCRSGETAPSLAVGAGRMRDGG